MIYLSLLWNILVLHVLFAGGCIQWLFSKKCQSEWSIKGAYTMLWVGIITYAISDSYIRYMIKTTAR